MKIGFFVREALRALRRSAAPSFAATLTIVITALVLGVFIPVWQSTSGTADEVRDRVVVDVYVKDAATDAEREQLKAALIAAPNVKSVSFISKDQALKKMQKRNKDAFELLGRNPLPDSFRVTPRDPDGVNALVDDFAPRDAKTGVREPRLPAIDEIRNRERDTKQILSATGLVKAATGGLALLFTLASVALIANTIRLSMFARRREVEVMKLVGATNWFIRWPFVIEGILVGLLGGALAVLLLALGKTTVIDPLGERFAWVASTDTIHFGLLAALLLIACVAVSAIGSGLTLRRFLRV